MPRHHLDVRIALADLLIKHEADIKAINVAGMSILDAMLDRLTDKECRLCNDATRFVKTLIENGAEVNVTEERAIITQQVIKQICPNSIQAIINMKMNRPQLILETTTIKRESPLMKAVRARHEEITKVLIDAGADVNYVGTDDNDALSLCIAEQGKIVNAIRVLYTGKISPPI